jgi:DNA-directed RNA polymerase sigma subunit (sigma70/sigma32)
VANEGPHTLAEIATFLGLTTERARQLEEQAFEQLNLNSTMKGLHDESPH